MRRVALMALFAALVASSADAGEFWRQFWKDYERNKCWPQPFVQPDRMAARAPWEIMAANGWRAQNTMTAPLFTEENELTEAGRRKIFWIATQAPVPRRNVFVMIDENRQVTDARAAAVQRYVVVLAQNGISAPGIQLTDREPIRWSGDFYNRVEAMRRESIPPPVLPDMVLTTDGP